MARTIALNTAQARAFIRTVTLYHKNAGRHDLPWRQTQDPYHILVSEIMLQQTQVERVLSYYKRFLAEFPTVFDLAKSDLSQVLTLWIGLGYNRRAKMLRDCAQTLVAKNEGIFPQERSSLEALPGIGPYTAGAIRAFAFNQSDLFIETNIRTVVLHHFFPRSKSVPDSRLMPILEKCVSLIENPREWYAALMDYGTYLKKMHPNPSRRSKHHTKQSKFEGSLRQMRGAIVRELSKNKWKKVDLQRRLGVQTADIPRFERALQTLVREGMILVQDDTLTTG